MRKKVNAVAFMGSPNTNQQELSHQFKPIADINNVIECRLLNNLWLLVVILNTDFNRIILELRAAKCVFLLLRLLILLQG